MSADIEALRGELLKAVADLGGMATNLAEAADWAGDERLDEVRLSLEAVSAGAGDAHESLRRIAIKCEELCAASK